MGLNYIIGELAVNKLRENDSTLYDAITEMDADLIKWLVNNRYRLDILNIGFVKERISIAKMIHAIEENLCDNKRIKIIK